MAPEEKLILQNYCTVKPEVQNEGEINFKNYSWGTINKFVEFAFVRFHLLASARMCSNPLHCG